jgi:LacI family transcriptional regulator
VVNREPTAQLVDHLAQHGHRRIAMIASHPGLSTTDERSGGFQLGLARNGLADSGELIRVGDDGVRDTRQLVDDAIEDLLSLREPPSAIVLGNNKVGIEAIRALQKRRLRVPGDIAVAMFDDFPWSDLFHPRLTAMSQPVEEIGATAVSMLMERLAGDTREPRQIRLDPVFRIRESCGCTMDDAA